MRLWSAWDRVRHGREKVSAVCARREVMCAPFCGGGLMPIVRCGAIAGVPALFLASGAKVSVSTGTNMAERGCRFPLYINMYCCDAAD